MKPRRMLALLALAAFVATAAVAGRLTPPEAPPKSEWLAIRAVDRPAGVPTGLVVLFSGADGWGWSDMVSAWSLSSQGLLVLGVDLPDTYRRLAADTSSCTYVIGAIETVSHEIQKTTAGGLYRDPIVAGTGAGGAFALALAAQTPKAAIGRIVAVDPDAAIAVDQPLCTGAPRVAGAGGKGWVYGLEPHPLNAPVTVVSTAGADAAGAVHVADLVAAGFAIDRQSSPLGAHSALETALGDGVRAAAAAMPPGLADLPITLLPADPAFDTMAIVLSGDGGWRDIDSQVAGALAGKGIPTVGLDSMRYFWSEKDPEWIAADLHRIIAAETAAWHVSKVILVGYSFGADVLPATWPVLAPADRDRIGLVSLLAVSQSADFEFKLSGLVGLANPSSRPTLPDIRAMPPDRLQCIYGAEDDDSVCSHLAALGVEVIRTDGGHHFDGDYRALAARIIARLGTPAPVPAAPARPTILNSP